MGPRVPERRCAGCGVRARQDELVRFRLDTEQDPPRVVLDTSRRRLGRGAYVCAKQVCVDRALRRRGFQRAFRTNVHADAQELIAAIRGRQDEETGPMVGD
ncbi:MAG: YlxR family protein [Thermoleophilia bacterium]